MAQQQAGFGRPWQPAGAGEPSADTIARTYRLQPETIARLDKLAAATLVWQSTLVDVLLAYALDELDAGAFQVRTRPVAYAVAALERH